jgi:hypothetical protein
VTVELPGSGDVELGGGVALPLRLMWYCFPARDLSSWPVDLSSTIPHGDSDDGDLLPC